MADPNEDYMRKTVAALYPLLYPNEAPRIFEVTPTNSLPSSSTGTPIPFLSAYPPVQPRAVDEEPRGKSNKVEIPAGQAYEVPRTRIAQAEKPIGEVYEQPRPQLIKSETPAGAAFHARSSGQIEGLNGALIALQAIAVQQSRASQTGVLDARGMCIWQVMDLLMCALESLLHRQWKMAAERRVLGHRIEEAEYIIGKVGTWVAKVEGKGDVVLRAAGKTGEEVLVGRKAEDLLSEAWRPEARDEVVQEAWSPL